MSESTPAASESGLDGKQPDPAAWEQAFREKFANIEQPAKSDSAQTTIIRGQNKWATCWRDACYLAKYIYKLPDNPNFFTEFPEEMTKVVERWEPWDELLNDPKSGLMAQLFRPRGYDPETKNDCCALTLVFRGTDFDDFRDIAMRVSVQFFRVSSLGKLVPAAQIHYTFAPGFPEKSGLSFKNLSDNDFLELGYRKFPILQEPAQPIAIPVAKAWGVPFFSLDTIISAELAVFAKEDGDWCNNFLQGIGEPSKQYEQAIKYGRKIAKKKIQTASDKRLEITGHSLGGGLASAVCCVLNEEFPNIQVHGIVFNAAGVHVNTIARALGGGEEHARGAISANPAIDICVRDEILTTLSANYQKMPIMGAVFNLAQKTLKQHGFPPPIARQVEIRAVSSGTVAEDAHNEQKNKKAEERHLEEIDEYNRKIVAHTTEKRRKHTHMYVFHQPEMENAYPGEPPVKPTPAQSVALRPKGTVLPILFPLERQSAFPPPKYNGFPLITKLDEIFSSAASLVEGANKIFEYVDKHYVDPARENNWTPYGSLKEAWQAFKEDIAQEAEILAKLMGLSTAYHGMDIVIASYENYARAKDLPDEQPQAFPIPKKYPDHPPMETRPQDAVNSHLPDMIHTLTNL